MKARLVVVSGLPASGKTTLGAALGDRLGVPVIDKDAILEGLFDSLGCPDREERHRLSRASDEVVYALAEASGTAVVVNWWDRRASPPRLRAVASSIVEVLCECPVEVAAARFAGRTRHPGHHDAGRSPEEVAHVFWRLGDSVLEPLGVGPVVRVDTAGSVDNDAVAQQVAAASWSAASQEPRPRRVRGHVLVGGWPGAGKTTLSRALAAELGVPVLSKDVVKEALMDALGTPADVEESRRLGRAAVVALLAAARGFPAAVVDSTWYPCSREPARGLPAPVVEVRCHVPLATARDRYRRRVRDPRHLDDVRTESELWGREVPPLGLGPVLDVDTSGEVDVARLAATCRSLLGS